MRTRTRSCACHAGSSPPASSGQVWSLCPASTQAMVFRAAAAAAAWSKTEEEGREEREIGVEGEWDDKSQTLIVIYKEHGNGLIWTLIGLSLLTEADLYNVSASKNRGINRGSHFKVVISVNVFFVVVSLNASVNKK